jgi:hypothetical protein
MRLSRGAAWQGHAVMLNPYLGYGLWECIGANQHDTTSYANHKITEAVRGGVRRYVPPTIKDLGAADSKGYRAR